MQSRSAFRALLCAFPLAACAATATPPRTIVTIEEMSPRFVEVDGASVHYRTNGGSAREAVVLIHGWSCNMGFCRHQAGALSRERRLVLVDLPGHGGSEAPEVDYTLERFARAIVAVMDDAGVDRAVLVGHSMGTAVALTTLRRSPERVKGLVAVDGAPRPFEMPAEQRERFVARFEGPQSAKSVRAMVAGNMAARSTPETADWIVEQMLRTPQSVMASAMREMRDPAAWTDEPITVPLAIVDADSPFWTDEYEAWVHRLAPQVRWRTLNGVGHFLMLDDPEGFQAALLDVLQETGA